MITRSTFCRFVLSSPVSLFLSLSQHGRRDDFQKRDTSSTVTMGLRVHKCRLEYATGGHREEEGPLGDEGHESLGGRSHRQGGTASPHLRAPVFPLPMESDGSPLGEV